jgi:hypothetical protein
MGMFGGRIVAVNPDDRPARPEADAGEGANEAVPGEQG